MQQYAPFANPIFNNADSFAQAFDEAWKAHSLEQPEHGLPAPHKLEKVLELVGDHPFAQGDPNLARQVAEFRIRLLAL